MSGTDHVRRAGPGDAERLAGILAEGFMDDPVSRWLFPDAEDRASRHPAFFRVFTDHVLARGAGYLTTTNDAAALWLDVDPEGPQAPEIAEELLAAALGPNLDRFRTLDALMQAGHPHQPAHAYLPFVAVLPRRQNHGIGAALLRHRLVALDATGTPAYLEASSARSLRLYERLGFTSLPATIELPDGPEMYPMWRPAHR
ncbi:MAG TPA: GNAT family N-acetyltransferase [Mycobacteriales bacterium]|nr:GNAT family N-acetyltransferase [Mycobacteriales bacterium]